MNHESTNAILLGIIGALAIIGLIALFVGMNQPSQSREESQGIPSSSDQEEIEEEKMQESTVQKEISAVPEQVLAQNSETSTEEPATVRTPQSVKRSREECRIEVYRTVRDGLRAKNSACEPAIIRSQTEEVIEQTCPELVGDEMIIRRLVLTLHRSCLEAP